jgi:hypothetical protein
MLPIITGRQYGCAVPEVGGAQSAAGSLQPSWVQKPAMGIIAMSTICRHAVVPGPQSSGCRQ